jgi:hypothetical protein
VRPTNALAVVSLIAGIASFIFVPFIGAIVAVITGHVARSQVRRTGEGGDGMALAGLTLGYVHLVLWVIGFLFIVLFVIVIWLTSSGNTGNPGLLQS